MLTYSYTALWFFVPIYCWYLDKYRSQFIEYQQNKQPGKIYEHKIYAYTRMSEKWGLSHRNPEKSGHSYTFCWKKGANHIPGSAEKGGPFGTHIRTMPYIGSYPPPPPRPHTHTTTTVTTTLPRFKHLTPFQIFPNVLTRPFYYLLLRIKLLSGKLWHSTDVRAEWPPFSALPGIWLAPFFQQKVYDWPDFSWFVCERPHFSDIPINAYSFSLRDLWRLLVLLVFNYQQ